MFGHSPDRPTRSAAFKQAWASVVSQTRYRDRRGHLQNPDAIDPEMVEGLELVVLNTVLRLDGRTMAAILRGDPAGDADSTTLAEFIRRLWGDPMFHGS